MHARLSDLALRMTMEVGLARTGDELLRLDCSPAACRETLLTRLDRVVADSRVLGGGTVTELSAARVEALAFFVGIARGAIAHLSPTPADHVTEFAAAVIEHLPCGRPIVEAAPVIDFAPGFRDSLVAFLNETTGLAINPRPVPFPPVAAEFLVPSVAELIALAAFAYGTDPYRVRSVIDPLQNLCGHHLAQTIRDRAPYLKRLAMLPSL